MHTSTRDGIRPSILRSTLKQMLVGLLPDRRSSHITEAIASGCGYNSHAAYIADTKDDAPFALLAVSRMDAGSMADRLASLAGSTIHDEMPSVSTALRTVSSLMPTAIVPIGSRSRLIDAAIESSQEASSDHDPITTLIRAAIAAKVQRIGLRRRAGVLIAHAMMRGASLPYPAFDGIDLDELVACIENLSGSISVGGKSYDLGLGEFRGMHVLEIVEAKTGDDLLDHLVESAIERRASHIRIDPAQNGTTISFRIDGRSEPVQELGPDATSGLHRALKLRCRMDAAETRIEQSGGFVVEAHGRSIDVRANTIPHPDGEMASIRILNERTLPLEDLGIARASEWRRGIGRKQGLCLVCGPTSSGRTTTLNATLRKLGATRRSAGEDKPESNSAASVGLDFAKAIRNFMRSAPDAIVLGEIRSREDVRKAIKLVANGHLVLAELHTGSIGSALARLADLGMEAAEARTTVGAILVQTLARTVCTTCRGAGCDHCHKKGMRGRTAVSEVMVFDSPEQVQAAIDLNWSLDGGRRPWPTMLDDGLDKAIAGITTIDEVRKVFGEGHVEERAVERGIDLAGLEA